MLKVKVVYFVLKTVCKFVFGLIYLCMFSLERNSNLCKVKMILVLFLDRSHLKRFALSEAALSIPKFWAISADGPAAEFSLAGQPT